MPQVDLAQLEERQKKLTEARRMLEAQLMRVLGALGFVEDLIDEITGKKKPDGGNNS